MKTNVPKVDHLAPVKGWRDSIHSGLDALANFRDRYRPTPGLPDGADPAEYLAIQFDMLKGFGVNPMHRQPLEEAAKAFGARFSDKDGYASVIHDLLRVSESTIIHLLNSGVRHEQLIRTLDFGYVTQISLGDAWLSVGSLPTLDESHPLRAKLPPDDDLFLLNFDSESNSGTPAVVLGPPQWSLIYEFGPDRPYHYVDVALALTAASRAEQRKKHKEAVEKKKAEERKELEQFWETDLGKQIRRDEEAKRLAAAGKIPPFIESEPAVRGPTCEPTIRTPEERQASIDKRVRDMLGRHADIEPFVSK